MQLLKRFGCGCVGIHDPESNQQLIIVKCWDEDDYPIPFFHPPDDRILPDNLTNSVFLSKDEQDGIFDRINNLLGKGRRLETIQRMLEIEVKP